jgi:DNA mismatch endonuclease (patch repair protein)
VWLAGQFDEGRAISSTSGAVGASRDAGAVYKHLDPGPVPPASSPVTSRVMHRTRRSGTRPEMALRRALHRRGLRFVVDRPVPGGNRRRRVDILLRGSRVAVFVDGCFWHSCPEHSHLPKSNTSWWRLKFRGIARRDRDTDTQLAAAGWLAVRIWEHEDPIEVAQAIEQLVRDRTAEKQLRRTRMRPAGHVREVREPPRLSPGQTQQAPNDLHETCWSGT